MSSTVHDGHSHDTRRNQPTPGTGSVGRSRRPRDPVAAHASESSVRPFKAVGLAGYGFLLAAIVLVAVVLAAAALGTALTPWVIAAVVCTVLAVACLFASRRVLTSHDAEDRPQHDPLIPEVTAEESAQYERLYHGRPPR